MDLLVGGWSERIKRGGRRLIMLTNSNTEGEFYPAKKLDAVQKTVLAVCFTKCCALSLNKPLYCSAKRTNMLFFCNIIA
jgi:hypothetical protein